MTWYSMDLVKSYEICNRRPESSRSDALPYTLEDADSWLKW